MMLRTRKTSAARNVTAIEVVVHHSDTVRLSIMLPAPKKTTAPNR